VSSQRNAAGLGVACSLGGRGWGRGGCRGDDPGLCDHRGGSRWPAQGEAPLTGNDSAHQRQSGKTQNGTTVHDGSPFPAAQKSVSENEKNLQ